jgi:hypothetical protein
MSIANPFTLVRTITEFKAICEDLSNAPNDVRMLSMEIDTYVHTLTDLQQTVDWSDSSDGLRQTQPELENIFNMITTTLVKAKLFLSENANWMLRDDAGAVRIARDKGRWVLKAADVKRLKKDLQTCERAINSYISRETL